MPTTIPIIWTPLPARSAVVISCVSTRPCALTFTEAAPTGVKPDWAVPVPSTLNIDTTALGDYVVAGSVDFLDPAPTSTTLTFTVSATDPSGNKVRPPTRYSLSGVRGDPTSAFFLLFSCV